MGGSSAHFSSFFASGSEIFAGALQHYQRAVVLGSPTYGRGTIQTMIPLKIGGTLMLTTGKVYLVSGRGLNGKGIAPDIIVKQHKEQESDKQLQVAKKLLYRAKDLSSENAITAILDYYKSLSLDL